MKFGVSRLMLAMAAAILALGGVMHSIAFWAKALRVIKGSNLNAFFAREMEVLWLADSTTLISLAVLFGYMVARPRCATKPVILLLSIIPGATTVLLYRFIGLFYAAHMLLAATLMVIAAGLTLPPSSRGTSGLERDTTQGRPAATA
jgi:hypothetical protein